MSTITVQATPGAPVYEGPEPEGAGAIQLCADVLAFVAEAGQPDFGAWEALPPGDDARRRFVHARACALSRSLFASPKGRMLVARTLHRIRRDGAPVTGDGLDQMGVRDLREIHTSTVYIWFELGFFSDLPRPAAPPAPPAPSDAS